MMGLGFLSHNLIQIICTERGVPCGALKDIGDVVCVNKKYII